MFWRWLTGTHKHVWASCMLEREFNWLSGSGSSVCVAQKRVNIKFDSSPCLSHPWRGWNTHGCFQGMQTSRLLFNARISNALASEHFSRECLWTWGRERGVGGAKPPSLLRSFWRCSVALHIRQNMHLIAAVHTCTLPLDLAAGH